MEFNFLSCSALVILIFSLDLFGFDVADLWPKCQFDSLNFEGIIRFEVSFFSLALHSFLLFLHREGKRKLEAMGRTYRPRGRGAACRPPPAHVAARQPMAVFF